LPTPDDGLSELAQQLLGFLRSKLGNEVIYARELTRLQGGFDTDTYSFAIENAPAEFPQKLVLRHFRGKGESTRVTLESTIQSAAHSAGHAVPNVPIDSSGHLLNDRPFLLMELLPGAALGSLIDDESLLRQLPGIMANLQAGLHKIDTSGLRQLLTSTGVNVETLTPMSMLTRISRIAEIADERELSDIHIWLIENTPDPPEFPTLCHGDFHPNNILYGEGKITGLIDWSNLAFAHAEFDIAITRLTLSIGPPELDVESRAQMQPLIDQLIAEYLAIYRTHLPLDDDLLAYYGVLRSTHAYAKIAAARLGIDLPYVAGDGYAWNLPPMYAAITNTINAATGVTIPSN
jgi:aminoglycoside phosphotransferase (APT) family kinase protein